MTPQSTTPGLIGSPMAVPWSVWESFYSPNPLLEETHIHVMGCYGILNTTPVSFCLEDPLVHHLPAVRWAQMNRSLPRCRPNLVGPPAGVDESDRSLVGRSRCFCSNEEDQDQFSKDQFCAERPLYLDPPVGVSWLDYPTLPRLPLGTPWRVLVENALCRERVHRVCSTKR